jgi:hypothetical protein
MAKALDASAERENISRAEAVRRAVAAYLTANQPPSDKDAFAIWKRKRIDSRAYEDNLRKEWGR